MTHPTQDTGKSARRHPTTKPACLCYAASTMTVNPTTTREDVRPLGIIISSAGLVSAFLEGGDLMLAGIVALVHGNLGHNP